MVKTPDEVRRLLAVARGQEPADLVLTGARLLNVYTGEVSDGWGVATAGPYVAYVGPAAADRTGPQSQVVDAGGRWLVPGLVDGHTHALWRLDPAELLAAALAGGTTGIVSEVQELAVVAGRPALDWALAVARQSPANLFLTLPAPVALAPGEEPAPAALDLLAAPEVVGVGEVPWVALLHPDQQLLAWNSAAVAARRTLEGHGAGARDGQLQAYVAAGYGSDHEPITAEEVVERLRLGVRTMIRQGSVRRDLEGTHQVRQAGVDLRHLLLVTDSVSPLDLVREGYLDAALRRALDLGFDPVTAYRLTTLNVAEHFGLVDFFGGVGPGRSADLAVVTRPGAVPDLVFARGRLAARDGEPVLSFSLPPFPPEFFATADHGHTFSPADFPLPAGEARVVDQVTDLVTREGRADFGGSLPADVAWAAVAGRGRNAGRFFVGFLRGLGLAAGAVATTFAWDTAATVAVGRDPIDLAAALNGVAARGGGLVIARDGQVVWDLPAPGAGLIIAGDRISVARRWAQGLEVLAALGCRGRDPFLTLEILTTRFIPHWRLSWQGYVGVKEGEVSGW